MDWGMGILMLSSNSMSKRMKMNIGWCVVIIKYSPSQSHHWSQSCETAVLITVEHYHVQQLNKQNSSSQEMSGWFRTIQCHSMNTHHLFHYIVTRIIELDI